MDGDSSHNSKKARDSKKNRSLSAHPSLKNTQMSPQTMKFATRSKKDKESDQDMKESESNTDSVSKSITDAT